MLLKEMPMIPISPKQIIFTHGTFPKMEDNVASLVAFPWT
jgi:hypothetical protein